MGTWEEQRKEVVHRKKAWIEERAFDFHTALLQATNEEEVKAAYIREFSLPANMKERHDLKVKEILFEFKYSVDFGDIKTSSRIVSQAIYYIRRLYLKGQLEEIKYLIIADKDEAKVFRVSDLRIFYESGNYDWDGFRPSSPDPSLICSVRDSRIIESNRTYKILKKDELEIFSKVLYKILFSEKPLKSISASKQKLKLFSMVFTGLGIIVAVVTLFLLLLDRIRTTEIPIYLAPENLNEGNL